MRRWRCAPDEQASRPLCFRLFDLCLGAQIGQVTFDDLLLQVLHQHIPPRSFPEQWDTEGLRVEFHRVFNIEPPIARSLLVDW